MDLQDIKEELKEMYPNMQGFIQHTLVAEMCLKWHEKQVKNCSIPDVVEPKGKFYCYKKCGKTEPYNDVCLNCGSSINYGAN